MESKTGKLWVEKYKAAMVLGGVGDAMGYRRGQWEFSYSGPQIHKEVESMGGIKNISVSGPDWIVSDDTVMHLATAEALIEHSRAKEATKEDLYLTLAKHYIRCMDDMKDRAAGLCTTHSVSILRQNGGYEIPFNKSGGGCGAAMRAMCIGMYYPGEAQLQDLIAVSIESGRMTHNHPTGYLGALASALFVHCAVQGYPIQSWGKKLVDTLGPAWEYVEKQGRDVEKNKAAWNYFENAWRNYLKVRGIEDGVSMPQFPDVYGVPERDEFYKSVSFSGWGGSSGHDAPMIAYDALLGAGSSWEELCNRAILHGGDNDSTGTIAGTCFGILHGLDKVPKKNYAELEYRKRLEQAGEKLFNIANEHIPDNKDKQ